jgi:hypothetical protein
LRAPLAVFRQFSRELSENSYPRAKRLTISRVIAA